jgi:hydroxypyruvate isomerase
MRFEPNLSLLFTELPLLERPRAAAKAGFDGAELWWPFAEPDPGSEAIDALAVAFEEAGLTLACLNFFGGDFPAGERGVLSLPHYRDAWRANIACAVRLAERLQCRTLNALYGNQDASIPVAERESTALDNLADAVAAARGIEARVVIEALNPVEYPAYGLHRVADVVGFLDRARRERGVEAWCSFDLYHAGRIGDPLEILIERYADRIGHVQIADAPGRIEPGTGTLDLIEPLKLLTRLGYDGWVGLEYTPGSDSHASLRRTMNRLVACQETPQRA